MIALRVISFALCLFLIAVAGAAGQTKLESAAKPSSRASGQAMVYVMRPNSLGGAIWGRLSSPDIKVDGRKIGELVAGTYLVVNSPAGHHTLEINSSIAGPWQSDVTFAPGQTYFIEIAPKPSGALGQDLGNALVWNAHGQFMPGHGVFAGFAFYSLDVESGRAEIANLKKISP